MSPAAVGAASEVERRIAPVAAAIASARRVAIVRLGSIGDVIETLPFAWILKGLLPEGARLEWIVHREAAPLLEAVAALDAVIAIPRARGVRAIGAWRRAVASRDYDLLFDLHGNVKSGAIARLSRARMRVGFDRADCREAINSLFTTHALPRFRSGNKTRRVLELGRWLGVEAAVPRFDFAFSTDDDGRAREVLARAAAAGRPVAILQLGRVDDVRSWPAAGYVELALALAGEGRAVIVTGGPTEVAAGDELRRLLGERAAGVQFEVGTLDLRELGATFQRLARDPGRRHVFVGPDGGGLHLAAACGMRVVGLFGPQDPERTAPIGERVAVLYRPEVDACVPCARRECSNKIPNLCMSSITAADVVAAFSDRPAAVRAARPPLAAPPAVNGASRPGAKLLAPLAWSALVSAAPLAFGALRELSGSPQWSRALATSALIGVTSWFAARLGGRRCALLAGLALLGMARVAWSDAANPLDLISAACVTASLVLYGESRSPAVRFGRLRLGIAALAVAASTLVAGSDGLILTLSSLALFELGERSPRRLLDWRFALPCLLLAPLAILARPTLLPQAMLLERDVSWAECGRFLLVGLLPASLALPFALFHHLKSRRFREDLGLADRAWRFPKAALLAASFGLTLPVCRGTAMVLLAPLLALLLAAWCERLWQAAGRGKMRIVHR